MLNYFEYIQSRWQEISSKIPHEAWLKRITTGELTKCEYASILQENYFLHREIPQLQAMTTTYFRNRQRMMVIPFLENAFALTGKDRLALDDIAALGFPTDSIPTKKPLPATTGLIAYPFYSIQYESPLTYLGYLIHLNLLTEHFGPAILELEGLKKCDMPKASLGFFATTSQNGSDRRNLEKYTEALINSVDEVETVINAFQKTAYFHHKMMDQAIERGQWKKLAPLP